MKKREEEILQSARWDENCSSKSDDVTGNKDGRTETDLLGERSALRRYGCDTASLGVRLF